MADGGYTRVDPVGLPEFDFELNAAICRNPMCENFGVDLDVEVPSGSKHKRGSQVSARRIVGCSLGDEWVEWIVRLSQG